MKNKYIHFLIDVINRSFFISKSPIGEADVLEALTGRRIGMDSVDMLTLYTLLDNMK